jgi:hypothetical protein
VERNRSSGFELKDKGPPRTGRSFVILLRGEWGSGLSVLKDGIGLFLIDKKFSRANNDLNKQGI